MLYISRFVKTPAPLLVTRGASALPFSSSKKPSSYEKVLEQRTERTTALQEKQWNLDQIRGKFDRGDINLFPNYQRGFKWKSPEASRLVLTVLGERFVPAIVVHQKKDNTYDVVDGKQRLSSLLSFAYGPKCTEKKLPTAAAELKGLGEDDEKLKGLTYDQLTAARKRQFDDYSLDVKIIPKQTNDDTVFAVYEDINSGGSKLTHHQLRRAAFYGPYIELIDELVKNKDFRAILDTDVVDESKDGEMVLRAFTVSHRYNDLKESWKDSLNREIIVVRDMNESDQKRYLDDRRDEFEFVMRQARDVFEGAAFRKYDEQANDWTKSVDAASLWGSLYHVLASGRKLNFWKETSLLQNKDRLKEVLSLAYKNHDFLELFRSGRPSQKTLRARSTVLEGMIKSTLKGVSIHDIDISSLTDYDISPRTFNRNRKDHIQELYDKQDGLCGICNQTMDAERLGEGKYVQIDHIKPFSKGGKTIKKNAQLVHAKCNQSKGAGD